MSLCKEGARYLIRNISSVWFLLCLVGVRFEFQILKAISNESESTDRENYSLVVLPQKLEVPVPYIDQNIECIPSMVSMIIAKGFDRL